MTAIKETDDVFIAKAEGFFIVHKKDASRIQFPKILKRITQLFLGRVEDNRALTFLFVCSSNSGLKIGSPGNCLVLGVN